MPKTSSLPPFQFRPEEKEEFPGFSVRTGKVSYYIRYRDPVSHRPKERVGGKTQTEVITKLRQLAPTLRVGRAIVSPTTLFWEVVEAWFTDDIIPHKKPSTEDNYRYYTERFLLPTFSNERFSHVTRPLLDAFLARLEDFDKADKDRKKSVAVSFDTRQQVIKAVKSLFRWAHLQGYSPTNEAAHLIVATNPEVKR